MGCLRGMCKFVRHLIVCAGFSGAALLPGLALAQERPLSAEAPPVAPSSAEPAEPPPPPSRLPLLLPPVRVPVLWAPGAYARAEPLLSPSDRPSSARSDAGWYGWQTLAVDGSSAAFILAGLAVTFATNSGAAFATSLTLGGIGLIFGGPIVHWAHGYTGKGLISLFGLRLGIAAGGFVIGGLALLPVLGLWALAITGPALAGVGLLTGLILDAAIFAREEPRAGEGDARPSARAWPRMRPMFAPMMLHNGGGMQLAMQF
ncbi:MAG: hypothetical protein U0269_31815 [Polyangiales bacterium]